MADVIYYKCNNDWVFFDSSYSDCEELLSFVFSIKILTDYIMHLRNNALDSFQELTGKKKDPCGSSSLIRTALAGHFIMLCVCVFFSLVCIGFYEMFNL